jgi:FkbM family methyltransferase
LAPVPSTAVRRLLTHPRVEPLVSTALLAGRTSNPARFVLAEVAARGRVVSHRPRNGGPEVLLEHGTPDIQAFDELFYQEIYAPPTEVDAALARLGRPPRLLDIGANIGLFGAWAHARWPGAEIDAFEPDPRNAAIHRRAIAATGGAGWRLHEAAASVANGEMRFAAGHYATSGPAAPDDRAAITVPARDVLPLMSRADLVKLDAEGSEWAILGDPRFPGEAVRVIALEYHPELCPGDDARAAAVARLDAAGFDVMDAPTQAPPGYGSVWAWSRST